MIWRCGSVPVKWFHLNWRCGRVLVNFSHLNWRYGHVPCAAVRVRPIATRNVHPQEHRFVSRVVSRVGVRTSLQGSQHYIQHTRTRTITRKCVVPYSIDLSIVTSYRVEMMPRLFLLTEIHGAVQFKLNNESQPNMIG